MPTDLSLRTGTGRLIHVPVDGLAGSASGHEYETSHPCIVTTVNRDLR